MSTTKEIKVQEKKLGRQNAWGQAWHEIQKIELDPRLVGKAHLDTIIHEIMHLQNPEWSETMVIKKSRQMTNVLWKLWYRKVDNRTRQPN